MTSAKSLGHKQQNPADEVDWRNRSMEERFAEVERLRVQAAGFADNPGAEPRMPKVLTVVRRQSLKSC